MCAVDEGIVSLREVLPDRDANNSWGAVLCEGTGIFAAVDYDNEKFVGTLLGL